MSKTNFFKVVVTPSLKQTVKQTVLVIDDCESALALQRLLLEMDGYEVFTAASGADALVVLSQIQEPNLILLDMQLGDMTGTQFLIELEEIRPDIVRDVPIVFLSGADQVPKSKAVGFIKKPADMDKFLKSVHSYIKIGMPRSHVP